MGSGDLISDSSSPASSSPASGTGGTSSATATTAVQVSNLQHTLPDGRPLFRGLDLTIERGESLALLGPSGGGKSTLLRMIAGLAPVDSGTIDLSGLARGESGLARGESGLARGDSGHGRGESGHARGDSGQARGDDDPGARASNGSGKRRGRHDFAVVFQQPNLFPWLSVRENVALGSRFSATRDRVRTDHIDELLGRFGIAELADARVGALSGGQAQRVSVIRAAATNPSLMLLDEPFSALDPITRGELQRWLVDVTNELAVTTLLVTHDVDEALVVGSEIALLGGAESSRITQSWRNPFRGGGTADGDESAADFRAEIIGAYSSAGRS